MILYRVLTPVEITKGNVVELTPDQARIRLHNLKLLKGSKYEVKADICFKAGEVIGFDPGTSRAYTGFLEKVESGKK